MYVTKRDKSRESVDLNKITNRIKKLCYGLDTNFIDPISVATKVVQGLYDEITTEKLDHLAAETAASLTTVFHEYSILAGRLEISNLHKKTPKTFSECVDRLYHSKLGSTGKENNQVTREFYEFVQANKTLLDDSIVVKNDYTYDYFGFKTLEKAYLLRVDNEIVERPQYMLMRVAIQLHSEDLSSCLETYLLLSGKNYIHGTPALFTAGSEKPQMSSCFLLQMQSDSISGIYNTLKQCAEISQSSGGIGLSVHNVRATGSDIHRTGGTSSGLVPMLKVFNDTARYVDQGGNKRKGAFAIYLEPWHADIFQLLDLKKNHGAEELRARDLFYGLWISDLFMRRVEEDQEWSLFCPNECPGLDQTHSEAFETLYAQYESRGRAKKVIRARDLWEKIMVAQIETGGPYMLYKDACNSKSNQKNLGVIKSSNLCTEIVQYTSEEEIAVCNLASISLPSFVSSGEFDFNYLYKVSKIVARNLNIVIDKNFYPLEEARTSNTRHRPIGIGVQGLADCYIQMGFSFESEEAAKLNREIFETIYFGAMEFSMEEAKRCGPYSSYRGSPISEGLFQFDLWNVTPTDRWDWETLRQQIRTYGVRNSLLLAPMPTASTSQILGNNECFEPYTSNIYKRAVLSGEHVVVNKYLQKDLAQLGLWDEKTRRTIIRNSGSVQSLDIPRVLKDRYKTVWEISQKTLIDQSADRGAYVCQSQSLNLFLAEPNVASLTSMHFYAWKKGLKTGMYYLKMRPAQEARQFTVSREEKKDSILLEELLCSIENSDSCEMCSG